MYICEFLSFSCIWTIDPAMGLFRCRILHSAKVEWRWLVGQFGELIISVQKFASQLETLTLTIPIILTVTLYCDDFDQGPDLKKILGKT